MRAWKKGLAGLMVVLGTGFLLMGHTVHAKTLDVKIDLRGTGVLTKRLKAVDKAKKVKVKCSDPTIVKAVYKKDRKDRRIEFTGKVKGNATVTVKCTMKNKKVKTYRYRVRVFKSRKVTAKDKGKKAFKIQNQYRKEKGVVALEWSDELYEFCLYRLKTSGFDEHKNLGRDTGVYFGNYAKFKHIAFGENMHSGYNDVKSAMKSLKNSPRHYQNLLSADHVCGAIACYKTVWCAIFYDKDKSEIENWRDYHIKEITVKRYDSQSGIYLSDSSISYYEEGNREKTLEAAKITETSGKKIYLEVGKTYVIYERKAPDGYEKAEREVITVTEDGIYEVILQS